MFFLYNALHFHFRKRFRLQEIDEVPSWNAHVTYNFAPFYKNSGWESVGTARWSVLPEVKPRKSLFTAGKQTNMTINFALRSVKTCLKLDEVWLITPPFFYYTPLTLQNFKNFWWSKMSRDEVERSLPAQNESLPKTRKGWYPATRRCQSASRHRMWDRTKWRSHVSSHNEHQEKTWHLSFFLALHVCVNFIPQIEHGNRESTSSKNFLAVTSQGRVENFWRGVCVLVRAEYDEVRTLEKIRSTLHHFLNCVSSFIKRGLKILRDIVGSWNRLSCSTLLTWIKFDRPNVDRQQKEKVFGTRLDVESSYTWRWRSESFHVEFDRASLRSQMGNQLFSSAHSSLDPFISCVFIKTFGWQKFFLLEDLQSFPSPHQRTFLQPQRVKVVASCMHAWRVATGHLECHSSNASSCWIDRSPICNSVALFVQSTVLILDPQVFWVEYLTWSVFTEWQKVFCRPLRY